jgi:hypothetical protein
MSNDENDENEKSLVITRSSLARWAGDVTVILTLVATVLAPAWYFGVSQPIAELNEKVNRIEGDMGSRTQRVNQIDKNVAVILERTQRQEESLNSIRRYIENGSRK